MIGKTNTGTLFGSFSNEMYKIAAKNIKNEYNIPLSIEDIILAHKVMKNDIERYNWEYLAEELLDINVNMYVAILKYLLKSHKENKEIFRLYLILSKNCKIGQNRMEPEYRILNIYKILLSCYDFDFRGLDITKYLLADLEEFREQIIPVETLPSPILKEKETPIINFFKNLF